MFKICGATEEREGATGSMKVRRQDLQTPVGIAAAVQALDAVHLNPKTTVDPILRTTMTTIPSRLARTTSLAHTPQEARAKVLQLYRDWYRSVRFTPSRPALHNSTNHLLPTVLIGPRNRQYLCAQRHSAVFPAVYSAQVRGEPARNRRTAH